MTKPSKRDPGRPNGNRRVVGGMPVQTRNRWRGECTGYFDGRVDQVRRIREWCQKAIRMDDERAAPVLLIVSELATNAILHSASGDQYGRVRVTVELMPGDFVLLRVIDDGARVGRRATRPYIPARAEGPSVGGHGLALVSALSEKWWWTDHPGGLAVWVLVDPNRSPDDD